jgi:DNA-directed RNA polymerase specialized sigma24 family protein
MKTDSILTEKYLAAVVALLLEMRKPQNREGLKDEVLLHNLGFGTGEIAKITGKKLSAVSMAIKRGKK